MFFELSITIDRSPTDVFAFLRDIEQHPQEEGSKVLLLEKMTAGQTGVGTRYREVVQMLPFVKGEIISEITHFQPDERLEMDWHGGSMEGDLAYHFEPVGNGTNLIQRETLHPRGILRLLSPFIQITLSRALANRLQDIKEVLEAERDA